MSTFFSRSYHRGGQAAGHRLLWFKTNRLCWLVALCCLSLLGGCALLNPSPESIKKEPGIGACQVDTDCLQGQFCYHLGYCKAKGNDDAERISLQLLPSSSHTLKDPNTAIIKQQFVGITPASIHDRSIQVRVAFTVQGKVYWNDKDEPTNQKEKNISARLRFIDQESIPGQRLIWEITTDPIQTELGYQVRLSSGKYLVEIWPHDAQWPPYRTEIKIGSHQTLHFELPPIDAYVKVKGRLLSSNTPSTPMHGLKIQLISKEGQPISKVVETDEQGNFTVRLSKGETPHLIRIQQKDTPPLHPQLDIPLNVASFKPGETIDLGHMAVGFKGDTVQVSGHVQANQEDGGYPVANAHVRILGEISTGIYKNKSLTGTYIVNVRSDSSGYYKAELPPGTCHFEVIPPADSDRSRAYIPRSCFYSSQKEDLDLSPKHRIVGKVCQKADDGSCLKKLPYAQIQALWRKPLHNDEPQEIATPFRTEVSQNDGSYELFLDPGYYDFVYVPPNESGLARSIQTNVKINNNKAKPYIQLDGLLPVAKHLVGQILDKDSPIANITVEMYSYSPTEQTARLLGRSVTNSRGFFSIPYNPATPPNTSAP